MQVVSVVVILLLATGPDRAAEESMERPTDGGPGACNAVDATVQAPVLPLLPAGVEELRFPDLYEPIGRYGLEYTARLQSLDGKKVRILGFMVHRDQAPNATLLLTAMPVELHDHEYGQADDLPAASVWVDVPSLAGAPVPFTPGPLLITGTLQLGTRAEADGRASHVRLVLDAPEQPDAKDDLSVREQSTTTSEGARAASARVVATPTPLNLPSERSPHP